MVVEQIKSSIECWVVAKEKRQVLLLTVPEKLGKHPAFDQAVTGGIEAGETAEEACVREVWEETGQKIGQKDLVKIDDGFMVKIDETLTIRKTVFLLPMPWFTPVLSAAEHIGYKWLPLDDVASALYYTSNKETWQRVHSIVILSAAKNLGMFENRGDSRLRSE